MNKKVISIICIIVLLAGLIAGFFIIRHKVVLARNRKIMEERKEAAKNRKDGPIGVSSENDIRVPDLKGMTFEEAQDKLESSGFTQYYFSKEEVDSSLEKGLIVKTQPGPGVSFNKNDFISFTFYISNGKQANNN